MSETREARLILEDGTIFQGRGFGATGTAGGEVVFNTCLTGYQEVLTDPSYRGQIVAMTYPLIGNYGINVEDEESERPWLSGFIIRELSTIASNFRSTETLDAYLARHGIVAIEGIDTRALTRKLRVDGAMKGLLTTEITSPEELKSRLAEVPELEGRDLVSEVTRGRRIEWEEGFAQTFTPDMGEREENGEAFHVVTLDFGAKTNIFRSLVQAGFQVTVLPSSATADQVLELNPDGVMLSNGPGDPRVLEGPIATVKALLGKVPIFGICLGHQILAEAIGAKVFKLKFGHHGGNQPVKDLLTGSIEITSQNHGFAVEPASLEAAGGQVTHLHLNDETVSGMWLPEQRAMSVQYHPEASPGPHDGMHLFHRFRRLMRGDRELV